MLARLFVFMFSLSYVPISMSRSMLLYVGMFSTLDDSMIRIVVLDIMLALSLTILSLSLVV